MIIAGSELLFAVGLICFFVLTKTMPCRLGRRITVDAVYNVYRHERL